MGDKIRENRLRRMAKRMGFGLVKSRSRDPRAPGYGNFMIVDASNNTVVAGAGGAEPFAPMRIDDVEQFFMSEIRAGLGG